jgi:hypothetical protein
MCAMGRNRLPLFLALVAAAVALGFVMTQKPGGGKAPDLVVTGIYADDWQTNCGPLAGNAQSACTARLDAKYGRAAAMPLPPAVGR